MKMDYLYVLPFLLHLIRILKAELRLEIVRNIDGTEVPVYDVQEIAGRNLTLTCRLVADHNSSYFDDQISWGRKRRNIHFDKVEDLKKLTDSNLNLLNQFLEKSYDNEAVMQFQPLFPTDSGKYFCMSLKYKLFNIVKVNVNAATEPNDLDNYLKALDSSRIDFKYIDLDGPLSFPKFLCTDDMFLCQSGRNCFDYQYVCDNVKDCIDGSDENVYLCGGDPCEGKKRCLSGRCISESLCCDKFRDPGCMVNIQLPCCFEGEDKYHDDWMSPIITSHDDFSFSNDFNKYDIEEHSVVWNDTNISKPEFLRKETLWIVVPCVIILVLVIICIMVRQSVVKPANRSRTTRSSRQYRVRMPGGDGRGMSPISGISLISGAVSSASSSLRQGSVLSARLSLNPSGSISGSLSRSVSPNMNLPYDLPPSYDEAIANSHPVVHPLPKGVA